MGTVVVYYLRMYAEELFICEHMAQESQQALGLTKVSKMERMLCNGDFLVDAMEAWIWSLKCFMVDISTNYEMGPLYVLT